MYSHGRSDIVNLGTEATVIYDVVNTSGVTVGSIHIANSSSDSRRLYISIVPTGSSMLSTNWIVPGILIGGTGMINMSLPLTLASGDSLQGSGSDAGLNAFSSFLKLN